MENVEGAWLKVMGLGQMRQRSKKQDHGDTDFRVEKKPN